MPKPEVNPGRQGQENVPHGPKRQVSQMASPPWDPGTSPPRSPKRSRTMIHPPESAIDSIQGEQSVPSQDDPVSPDPAHRPKQQVTLHSDIYLTIVDHVVKYGKQRDGSQSVWNKTLLSLACTSQLLQDIVEKHIYRHPCFCRWNESMYGRNLDQAVNVFLFALSARPSRADVVRNLGLTYSGYCSNIEQLIQTVQACPNLSHLSLEWSPKTLPKGLEEQARGVARLLGSCSNKVRHFTFVKYDDEKPGQVEEASRSCSEFYEGLTSFTAAAPASDLMATLSSHYLPDLKYFRLEQCLDRQPYRRHSDRLLLEVSKTCPSLRTLDWGVTLLDLPSLQEACKVWGPTLRSLRVRINDTIPNPISQLLPLLPHLEELSIRTERQITRSDIEAIAHYARSTPLRLRNISLESRTHPMLTPGLPPIGDALVKLIDAVHPTLESLHLEYDCPVDPKFLKHLAKAKKLHHFYVEIKGRAKEEDLDLLSRECPRLKQIYFRSVSSARSFVPAPLY
ncbi:uncharacterized protein B0J16DRAFT_383950 [Fusarium flagelliforme]|uniref:F-box domain-containing protein n=1 Tax=Fusarium flagelliforme TaxID=2675880 RepID=A0A395MJC6_9HYPO|nr:uncharacterized protein B0J16DRAFT_383950 [Fusarium flagelliforme]KAH7184893.1 hypothetical protein B0J16DRAFT_383950 [Fusarium flagelliforme]RFN48027.1 hypothetical protein FIE12Z_7750 [Fusarium flagelliforme]